MKTLFVLFIIFLILLFATGDLFEDGSHSVLGCVLPQLGCTPDQLAPQPTMPDLNVNLPAPTATNAATCNPVTGIFLMALGGTEQCQ